MLIYEKNRYSESRNNETGVVLLIVLILLLVTSVIASVSIRGASSSEQVSNQMRLRTLAQQAAEGALRYCEEQVQLNALDGTKGFLPQNAPVGAPLVYSWETMANWDAIDVGVNAFVGTGNLKTVAFKAISDDGANMIYFKRQPECMAQYLTVADTKVFVATARGFGPEVGAKDGAVPKGTEVWLQSVVTIK